MAAHSLLLVVAAALCTVNAIDNGRGVRPPMGWRSWNLFGANVDQQLIQSQMDGITSRARPVNGVPTSLADLGYSDVGLDDNWQLCGSYGPNKYTFHNANGFPIVNRARFPNFIEMTDYAHSLNLTAGWYGNNCICSDHCKDITCYQGDVDALTAYGFDSIKLDGCGAEIDLDVYAALFNATGKSIMIENCHWGLTVPNKTWCPFNYYRTSGDIRASYAAVVSNLQTTIQFAKEGVSTPGCWAYPDMLEVGCAHGPGGSNDPGLSFVEARSHFGAWCIVSSPLILSHDMNNATITDQIWPIITNTEAIAVNQAWFAQAAQSGTVFAQSDRTVVISDGGGKSVKVAAWQQWYKPIDASHIAVLMMNHDSSAQSLEVAFNTVPGLNTNQVKVRDIWQHQDLGTFTGSYAASNVASHDSAFIMLSTA